MGAEGRFPFQASLLYFLLVAIPPRMCRTDLFSSRTFLTASLRGLLIRSRRSVTSLCTVDLEIPNFFAVSRTVALLSRMYSANCMVLSSMCAFTYRASFAANYQHFHTNPWLLLIASINLYAQIKILLQLLMNAAIFYFPLYKCDWKCYDRRKYDKERGKCCEKRTILWRTF